jgi:hypothetical protein
MKMFESPSLHCWRGVLAMKHPSHMVVVSVQPTQRLGLLRRHAVLEVEQHAGSYRQHASTRGTAHLGSCMRDA